MRLAVLLGLLITAATGDARVRHAPAPMRFVATAFSQSGETIKGTVTRRGIVAADPSVLPLGSVIEVSGAGPYSGRYTVTDTGSKVQGRHIDVFMPSTAAARQFGRKMVTVQVVVRGNNEKNDHKEVTPARRGEPVPPVPVSIARK